MCNQFKLAALTAVLVLLQSTGMVHAQSRPPVNPKTMSSASVWKLTLNDYLNQVDQKKPTITGGCVVLTSATLSATLLLMALNVSENHASAGDINTLESLKAVAKVKRDSLEILADADNDIYQSFIEAFRLPHQTPVQQHLKDSITHQLLIRATNSPLDAAKTICSIFTLYAQAEKLASKNVLSDVKTSETLLDACFRSVVILTADNISQLPAAERCPYQEQLDAIIKQEKLLFSDLIPSIK